LYELIQKTVFIFLKQQR